MKGTLLDAGAKPACPTHEEATSTSAGAESDLLRHCSTYVINSADGIPFKTFCLATVHKGVATRKQNSTHIKAIAIDHTENQLKTSDFHVCNNAAGKKKGTKNQQSFICATIK